MRYSGVVIWFKNKFGFLNWKKDDIQQQDLFVHYSDIDASGFRDLQKGDKVSFALGTNHHNKLKAIKVQKE